MAINTRRSKIYPCLPEYFNAEGRGMYSYLTGSASWFVLTMVTQSFGVRGKYGDLLIAPKLSREQFKDTSVIGIDRVFADRNLRINFHNPKKLSAARYKIIKENLNSHNLALKETQAILIARKIILNLPSHSLNTINIILG
jgi:cellobiose phosphorylase